MFDDIHQAENTISFDRTTFTSRTLELSGESPRQPCALRVGEGVLPGIERQDPACEKRMKSRMMIGC